MGEGSAQFVLASHMEGGAKITWSVAGMKTDQVSDSDREDYSEWVQSELDKLLENPLTKRMRKDLAKASRDYEIMLTQHNQVHLDQLELQDNATDGAGRLERLQQQNTNLLKEIETLHSEHEDLVRQLNDGSASTLEHDKKISSLERENNKLKKQMDIEEDEMREMEEHVNELQEKVNELKEKNNSLSEETSHVTLLNQQKEALTGRVVDLQDQVEAMKRNFHNAKKGEEEATAKLSQIEEQFLQMKSEAEGSINARQKSRNQIAELKEEINRLKNEIDELRAKNLQSSGRGAVSSVSSGGDSQLRDRVALLEHELEEQKNDFEDQIARKDRMLNEVKDALKSLGFKLGNLDSKMAIPKLKALLSILTQQVQQYKGRQKELEHLVKSRSTELQYYKEHFGDAVSRRVPRKRSTGGGILIE